MGQLFLDGCKLYHHLDRLNAWKAGEHIAPIHVEVSPTNACNMRCVFCYADHSEHRMGTLAREPFVALMRSMGRMGVRSCLLAGDGEPLVNNATPDAIVAGHQAGVDMALNSNALAMDEQVAKQVAGHLTWLRFSVMAADAERYAHLHGTRADNYRKVIDNIARTVRIKHQQQATVTIGIQQVLLPENACDVVALAKLAKDIGVDYYVLKPFSLHPLNQDYQPGDISSLPERWADSLREAEQLSDEQFTAIVRWNTFSDEGKRDYDVCLGLPFISQIAADGGVYTCCPFFGQERFCYGNINEQDFEQIWYSRRTREVMRDVRENVDVHTECMSYCRHHQVNRVLWDQTHAPAHVNFV